MHHGAVKMSRGRPTTTGRDSLVGQSGHILCVMHPPRPPHFDRYVALGDSSTEGLGDHDGEGRCRGWSQRLAERINAAQGGLHYANLAVRGLTTAEVRERQLDAALAMRPDLATVFCGTNDVLGLKFDPEKVAADIEHMQQRLIACGATVLSFTMPDLTRLIPVARLISARIVALNRVIVQASQTTGALLVDFAAQPFALDRRFWSEDRLHANSAGHARIAEALAYALHLPGSNEEWRRPFPTRLSQTRRQRWVAEARWIRYHLLPWVWQELAGQSAAQGRSPKRPALTPL